VPLAIVPPSSADDAVFLRVFRQHVFQMVDDRVRHIKLTLDFTGGVRLVEYDVPVGIHVLISEREL
jgi:hypothetical protein